MERILITGGLGFIGSNLAQYFADKGNCVICIDNLSRPGPNFIESLQNLIRNGSVFNINNVDSSEIPFNLRFLSQNYPQVKIYLENLCNSMEIKRIITSERPTIIIHAAGQTSAIDSIVNPLNDFQDNVVGLINVLEAVRQCSHPPIFLFLSTNKVYGTKINQSLIEEDQNRYTLIDPPNGFSEDFGIDQTKHTPYGVSKLAGDLYIQEYCRTYNIRAGIFRMSCIYGPQQFGFEGQGWISHLVIQALLNKPITIFGNGKQVRDILYISDLISLVEHFINHVKSNYSQFRSNFSIKPLIFNVGGGLSNSVSLREVLDIISRDLNEPLHIDYDSTRDGDQKVYISDISKVSRVLDWKPQISPKIGIHNVIEWTKAHLALFQ
ncbi:NAD-dependent epimerase/dehydratase family protein [Candidatus Harpocratesius sp.]